MAKEKNGGIYFKVSEAERQAIEQRMADAGIKNMSAFIRKMCLDGYIILLDIPEIRECSRYLASSSNNLNQIARHVNSGGVCSPGEFRDVQAGFEQCQKLFGQALEKLSKIA